MKKLFGHNKQKNSKGTPREHIAQEEHIIPTPIHQQHAIYGHHQSQPHSHSQTLRRTSSEEERWEVVSTHDEPQLRNQHQSASSPSRASSFTSLPPGASPPIPSPNAPRSPSPFSISTTSSAPTTKMNLLRDRDLQQPQHQAAIRKKPPSSAPVAVGILRALEPPRTEVANHSSHSTKVPSEERFISYSESGHRDRERDREKDPGEKKERKAFWSRDKEREKEREKDKDKDNKERYVERGKERGRDRERREEEHPAELTKMIGYLTATAAEDWAVVLEVCDRASANESNAKEAVRALKREFKYGEPPAQLSAARLWAIMLRYSSELFVSHCASRKFLDALEDLLNSSRTSPVVRERVLDVIAAAAYASGSKKEIAFRGLWRRVKPIDKPDEGVPFDNDDAMFNPPVSGRLSHYDIPIVSYQEPSPLPADYISSTPPPNPHRKRKSPTRNRIIPPEEDIRRLFQECKIGQGNAALLSQALALTKPEDLKKKEVIKEFYMKSRASHELIFAQIPWASAGAERSQALKDQGCLEMKNDIPNDMELIPGDESPVELTTEEKLLAALLAANAELIEALQQYEDMERLAVERKVEDRSRKDVRMDPRHLYQVDQDTELLSNLSLGGGSSRSPSPSHSPTHSPLLHPHPQYLPPHSGLDATSLAPPPAAPHGPRSPVQNLPHSRTPSPGTPILDAYPVGSSIIGSFDQNESGHSRMRANMSSSVFDGENDSQTPIKPSAKALGKRKVVDVELSEHIFDPDDIYLDEKDSAFLQDDRPDTDHEDDGDAWQNRTVQYVYDAAAERTQQRIREGHALVVNGVH